MPELCSSLVSVKRPIVSETSSGSAASPKVISLSFDGHFPGEFELAGFIEAEDDGSDGNNWSSKTY